MIDICTVVFEEELLILHSQAQSIDLYCKEIGINTIYVIVNDNISLNKIDRTWWGTLQDHVVVIPRSAFGSFWVKNGWVSQQVLKILGAATSYNTYTMVLDAKTIFVRELALTELLNNQQQLCVGQIQVYDVFAQSKQIVESLFNIKLELQAGPGGVPFFFHNDTVRKMIVEISANIDKSFPVWFQQQGMLTEFLLYSGFVIQQYGTLDKFYSHTSNFSVQNICHSEVDIYDVKFNQMLNDSATLTVSIHRRAWEKLSNKQRTQYKDFLSSKGISLWTPD